MIKYKITDKNMKTYNGCQWDIGVKKVINNEGNTLCTDNVFHYYDSPELAVLLNPIHGKYKQGYRLWKITCDSVGHDGLKGGSKWQILKKEIDVPKITLEQKIEFGIRCAREVYTVPLMSQDWLSWADAWISGENRSRDAAHAAYAAATHAANAATHAAAAATAADAAYAATHAANAATHAAAAATAADAAYAATHAATHAAAAAADAAHAAATHAATAAAHATHATAANFVKKLQKIIEIIFLIKKRQSNEEEI